MTSVSGKESTDTNRYQVRSHFNLVEFLSNSLEWLMIDEVANNSLLSLANAISTNKSSYNGPKWFGTIEQDLQTIACAVHVALDGLVISHVPKDSFAILCDELIAQKIEIRKVTGPHESCIAFANFWSLRFGTDYFVSHTWQCYKLECLKWPNRTAVGALRKADLSERELIKKWGEQYGAEKPAPISVTDFLLSKIEEGELYVWDDSGPKVLVCVSGKTDNCAGISAVYTPPEYRRKGYATAAVATITRTLLDEGRKFTTLLVDIVDISVMRIYEQLGYEKTDLRSNVVITPVELRRNERHGIIQAN